MTITEAPTTPACVYLLADHLDAALAAGEDLINAGLEWHACQDTDQVGAPIDLQRQRTALEDIRTYELLIIARVLQARDRANEVAELSTMFRAMAKLFVSGTTNVRDILETCADSSVVDFDTGDGITSYLRSRGLMQPDAACIEDDRSAGRNAATFEANFLLAARLPLNVLLDNVATFLDALDSSFDLYELDDDQEDEAVVAVIDTNTFDDSAYDDAVSASQEAARVAALSNTAKALAKAAPKETLAERLARLPQGS